MPEPLQLPVTSRLSASAAFQMASVNGRALLRVKSWLQEYSTDGEPVVLAGQRLPSKVGAVLHDSKRVLCIGPGEWLIGSHDYSPSNLRELIEPDLPLQGLALVDLSDALAVFELQGSSARGILSKGCGLDFHMSSFPVSRCARTRFAQIPVIIEHLEEPYRYEVYLARSHVHYLRAWLVDSAGEFSDAIFTASG